MKRKTIVLIVLAIVAIAAVGLVYNFVINPSHRDITSEEASASLSASEFFNQFSTNEAAALNIYLDKVVAISGTITAVETNALELDNKIQVGLLAQERNALNVGDKITLKGRCVGYDELLEMVKIDQATLTNQ